MGCREDFFNKTQKTGGRGGFCPCSVELGLNLDMAAPKLIEINEICSNNI